MLSGMKIDAYRAFTGELTERLERDERVTGLVALGSMAERDYGPDEWSDHDFFVVTRAGEQEALRTELSWLPRAGRIALSFRETDHGMKVVYDDGHLLEFAVFDLAELGLARVNRYRVLLDRGGVVERMEAVRAATAGATRNPREDARFHFGQLLTNALVGAGRHMRGEAMSGAFFVKSSAVRHLLVLVATAVPAERASVLDDLDPFRRFDFVYPEIAREVDALLVAPTVEAALGLLDVASRHVAPHAPGLPWPALEVVRSRLMNS